MDEAKNISDFHRLSQKQKNSKMNLAFSSAWIIVDIYQLKFHRSFHRINVEELTKQTLSNYKKAFRAKEKLSKSKRVDGELSKHFTYISKVNSKFPLR